MKGTKKRFIVAYVITITFFVPGQTTFLAADVAGEGLILHLDASKNRGNDEGSREQVWENQAKPSKNRLESPVLRHFRNNGVSGWVGSGTPGNPYALRFEGEKSYGVGEGNLELPELMIEVWAKVDDCGGSLVA